MSNLMAEQPGTFADPNTGLPVQAGASVVPQNQRVSRNPMLPQHPLGAYTDAQYEAAVAQLRAQATRQYGDVLKQLGYTDEAGNFVMGSAETDAAMKRSEAQYGEDRERQRVTNEMQQAGTLFSGYRGTQEGQRTMPFEQTKAQIGIDLPNQLSQLYEQAGNVVSDFITKHNTLLADAAGRATQNFIASPGGPGTGADPNAAPAAADPNAAGAGGTPPPDTGIGSNWGPPGTSGIPDFFAPLANATPEQLAGSLQPPPPNMALDPAIQTAMNAQPAAPAPNMALDPAIQTAMNAQPAAAPAFTPLPNQGSGPYIGTMTSPPPSPTPAPAYDPGQIAQAAKAKRQQYGPEA